jgi:photosystem II stability/assembly factor-like uncharacterized protein
MNVQRRFASVCALMLLLAAVLAPVSAAQTLKDDSLKGMKWRLIGPFRGGRVIAVEGVAGQPNVYYFGGVAGGVWKTTDGGLTWTPIFDKQPIASIGSIAVAPSDPNVVYVGTGEACLRGNISFGNGVYKSLDAGKTWTHIGLDDTRHIGRVIVDPHNPDVVFVAALGHAFGANKDRGVFRSTDGGKSWQNVLFKDEKTGAVDITFDPNNSHVLYASLWQVLRTPWSFDSGGPGSGLYKSSDGGSTWQRLEGHGLPDGVLGRIGVSVSPADSSRVYALIEAEAGGLYRSDDAGATWSKITDDHRFRQRAWYFTHIFADPKNTDSVYILNTGMYRSTDGGKSFDVLAAPHGDQHDLWIDPTNHDRLIEGDDGGATISTDGGKTWSAQNNQPTAQFYHVATDTRFPYYVYGAQQDNSTVAIASRSDNSAIGEKDWYDVGGGESGFVVPDPRDANIVYAGSYDGLITRLNKANGQLQDISPWPLNPMGSGAAELKHRFQWTAPIALSPHDPNVIYFGGELLFQSSDAGATWNIISPDLTRNDKTKQQSAGGPITQDNTSVEYFDTIFAIAESPVKKGLIWVGSDDGRVHLTQGGGDSWADVTPKDMPEWGTVSIIEPSSTDEGTAYVAVDRHRLDDFQPYIFATTNFGKSWTRITNGLPATSYVHVVREDPKKTGLLFAGTETGIFVSFDNGGHWQSLQLDLPPAPVHDLAIRGDDLIAATHGRAFWILDDITPLREITDAVQKESAHLYSAITAIRYRGGAFPVPKGWSLGNNPPAGAIIDFYLKAAPQKPIQLEILDSDGKVVRKFSSEKKKEDETPKEDAVDLEDKHETIPAEIGLNRFVWDLHTEPASKVPGSITWGGGVEGPFVLPGTYQVKLTADGTSYTTSIEVKLDPRVSTSPDDLKKQLDLGLKIRDRVTEAHDAVNQMRDLRAQLDALRKRLGDDPSRKDISTAAEQLGKKMSAVEAQIIQPKSKSSEDPLNFPIEVADQLMALGGTVSSADTAPTQASIEVFEELNRRLDEQLAKWTEIRDKDLAEFNAQVQQANIPLVMVTPVKPD